MIIGALVGIALLLTIRIWLPIFFILLIMGFCLSVVVVLIIGIGMVV